MAASRSDEGVLKSMGYAQSLYRGLNSFASFAFNFTSVGVLTSLSVGFASSMASGGPAVILWGWVICSCFTVCTAIALAEIAAVYPTAGSVYHWAAFMAPHRHSALLAYIAGTFNLLGNAAGTASFAWGFASFVASLRSLDAWVDGVGVEAAAAEAAALTTGQTVGVAVAVCTAWALVNLLHVTWQGHINSFAALWQLFSTIAIVVVVLAQPNTQPDADPALPLFWPWYTTFNNTGFDSNQWFGYVMLLGLLNSLFGFAGYEAGAHLSEETKNASKSTAWGIVLCSVVTALFGFVYVVGLCYATPRAMMMPYPAWVAAGGQATDDDAFAAPGDLSTGAYLRHAMYLVSENGAVFLYFAAAGRAAGRALGIVLVLNVLFAGVSALTVTARVAYAMARDGALPLSGAITSLLPATLAPVGAVVFTYLLSVALLLIGLGTTQGLYAVLSICVIGYQISYCIPILLRVFASGADFVAHPSFSLGRLSLPLHAVAGLWLVFSSMIFFWPSRWPLQLVGQTTAEGVVGVDDDNFNYTVRSTSPCPFC